MGKCAACGGNKFIPHPFTRASQVNGQAPFTSNPLRPRAVQGVVVRQNLVPQAAPQPEIVKPPGEDKK